MKYELPENRVGRSVRTFVLHLDDELYAWCINAITWTEDPKQLANPSLADYIETALLEKLNRAPDYKPIYLAATAVKMRKDVELLEGK
jgi:hypothetical protein